MTSEAVDMRPQDAAIVTGILQRVLPPGAAVYVFGSRARGRARRGSDLDLAIDAGRPLTFEESSELRFAFEESDLPYTVDVVDRQTISESFAAAIEGTLMPLDPFRVG